MTKCSQFGSFLDSHTSTFKPRLTTSERKPLPNFQRKSCTVVCCENAHHIFMYFVPQQLHFRKNNHICGPEGDRNTNQLSLILETDQHYVRVRVISSLAVQHQCIRNDRHGDQKRMKSCQASESKTGR